MDLVKLREREKRERGGEERGREGGVYYSVCEEETGGQERRGGEDQAGC